MNALNTSLDTLQARVVRKTSETADICSFELHSLDGSALPTFEAGAHIDVHIPNGPVRQYSLCNPLAATAHYEIAVLRDTQSRGGSKGMHALTEGQIVTISTPRNHFPLAKQGAKHHVLFAGGIGITPIWAMAQSLAQEGASFELHYCTRTQDSAAFLERIKNSSFADRCFFYHDQDVNSNKLNVAQVLAASTNPQTHLYVCGPSGFMDWVISAGREAGWSDERLHREYFSGMAIDTSADGSFDVRIASTGAVLHIPANESVSTILQQNGIALSTSCEQGICGTCVVRVLEGVPEHRDMYLTEEEHARNDQFTPCCSRSKSSCLVLDL